MLRGMNPVLHVDAVEFVATEHTPKNRLITARRQRTPPGRAAPRFAPKSRAVGLAEYRALRDASGGHDIALAHMLGAV